MKRSITKSVIAIVMLLSTVSFGSPNLSGQYWFGSLSVDVNTNEPWGKRGTVIVTDNNWTQVWDDNDGNHTFSSTFTSFTQLDGSVDINFPGETYNVAWNGDVMIHAGSVLGGGGEGIDIFMRKATDVDVNDVLGDHGFFGHFIGWGDDTAIWGNLALDVNGTAVGTWTNDHGDIESGTFDWDFDDVNSVIKAYGTAQYDPEHVALLFLGKGDIESTYHVNFEEGRDGNDIGYNIFIKKTDQVITMADIADTYQVRFLETGPGAVPYTCYKGTCVIEAVDDANGILSVDAYYSNGEHDVFSIDCSVGPGNEFHLDDNSVPDGIISPDKNLICVPEYRYENPPTRTDDDWLGGIFLIRMPNADCTYLLDGDLNRDCRVDFKDFSILAAKWLLSCNDTPLDPSCRCDIPWVAEPPMNVARDQFAGGVIDGNIYVFGGNGNPDGVNLKSTEVYNPATQQWTMLADNNHNNGGWGVEELTSAVVNDNLYVFGAYGGIGPGGYYGVFNFNEMYDPATDTWTTLAPRPTTLAAGPATVYNNEIYLFGGYFDSDNPSQNHINYDIVECYAPDSNTWRPETNMPLPMSNFGIATVGTKAYLFGGAVGNYPDIQLLDDVITYDFQTDTWKTTGYQPMPVKKAFMYSNSAPVIDGKVYLIGVMEDAGGELALSKRVDIYDPGTNTWEEGTPLPLPLDDHVALARGGKIYVLGGCNSPLDWGYSNRSKMEVVSYDTDHCSH
ncbi:MAG TPA: kelch repeat-containing protein [Sedimentisphaerales bacterium]|nr:kelch repeat-containing protein [Sedimentisphaerales bacterium]